MEMDEKKFKSFKRKVLKRYPNARTRISEDKKFFISDGEGSVIGKDFMIPPQTTVMGAWYWASRTVQLQQNLDRTHPLRTGMTFDEKKFQRVSRRNRRR